LALKICPANGTIPMIGVALPAVQRQVSKDGYYCIGRARNLIPNDLPERWQAAYDANKKAIELLISQWF
jgi:hypothetical protein